MTFATQQEMLRIAGEWWHDARPAQRPLISGVPANWLVLGGRGAGKTRLGAEWVNAHVRGHPPFAATRYGQIALVGETLADVREVMIDGPSGIIASARRDPPRYEPSRRRLVWGSGAVAFLGGPRQPARAAVRRGLVRRAHDLGVRRDRDERGRRVAWPADGGPGQWCADRFRAAGGDGRFGDRRHFRAAERNIAHRLGRTPAALFVYCSFHVQRGCAKTAVMKKATHLIAAAMLLAATAAPASALPFLAQPAAPAASAVVQVQANCNAVAQQIAAQYGGTPANVRMENRGGRTVCVGEVIVPARDGQMGRKVRFEEPL